MSDANTLHNRVVWFDLPVVDLDRAAAFYEAVLAISVHIETMEGFTFGVLAHDRGNGGCLVPAKGSIPSEGAVLIYLNVDGRIRDAVAQVEARGGKVLEAVHSIGPHGFRAVIVDSEGNRVALHSNTDA